MRTPIPNDPNEQPLYVLRRRKCTYYFVFILILCGVWSWAFEDIIPYLVTENVIQIHFIYDNSIEIKNINLIMCTLIMIPILFFDFVWLVRRGNIYFYERYFEFIPIIPFMKPRIMYYDNVHLYLYIYQENSPNGDAELRQYEKTPKWWENVSPQFKILLFRWAIRPNDIGDAELRQYEKMPKWWENPYTWFKIWLFETIHISSGYLYAKNYKDVPEILELLKKKAQSVTYDS